MIELTLEDLGISKRKWEDINKIYNLPKLKGKNPRFKNDDGTCFIERIPTHAMSRCVNCGMGYSEEYLNKFKDPLQCEYS